MESICKWKPCFFSATHTHTFNLPAFPTFLYLTIVGNHSNYVRTLITLKWFSFITLEMQCHQNQERVRPEEGYEYNPLNIGFLKRIPLLVSDNDILEDIWTNSNIFAISLYQENHLSGSGCQDVSDNLHGPTKIDYWHRFDQQHSFELNSALLSFVTCGFLQQHKYLRTYHRNAQQGRKHCQSLGLRATTILLTKCDFQCW